MKSTLSKLWLATCVLALTSVHGASTTAQAREKVLLNQALKKSIQQKTANELEYRGHMQQAPNVEPPKTEKSSKQIAIMIGDELGTSQKSNAADAGYDEMPHLEKEKIAKIEQKMIEKEIGDLGRELDREKNPRR